MPYPSPNLYPGQHLYPGPGGTAVTDGEFNDPSDNWTEVGNVSWSTTVLHPNTTTPRSLFMSTRGSSSAPSVSQGVSAPYTGELSFWAFSDIEGSVLKVILDEEKAYEVSLSTNWKQYHLPITITTSIKFELDNTISYMAYVDNILPSASVSFASTSEHHKLNTTTGNKNVSTKNIKKQTTTLVRRTKCSSTLEVTR